MDEEIRHSYNTNFLQGSAPHDKLVPCRPKNVIFVVRYTSLRREAAIHAMRKLVKQACESDRQCLEYMTAYSHHV